MLQFLNISNIALIDDMQVEFEGGLNLLTGETGSGKSIFVDCLGVWIGGRFTSELIKSGAERASIEGLFSVTSNPDLETILENAGLGTTNELIIRRELSATGRNKIFINNQLATLSLVMVRCVLTLPKRMRNGLRCDVSLKRCATMKPRNFNLSIR